MFVVTYARRFETIGPFSRAWLGYGPIHGLVARRYGFALSLTTVDNDENLLSILKKHLGGDPRLTVECADGDDFLRSARARRFDFIFADTWSGKYRLLEDALELLNPSGIYVIDDMLPQPNWPAVMPRRPLPCLPAWSNARIVALRNCPGPVAWCLSLSSNRATLPPLRACARAPTAHVRHINETGKRHGLSRSASIRCDRSDDRWLCRHHTDQGFGIATGQHHRGNGHQPRCKWFYSDRQLRLDLCQGEVPDNKKLDLFPDEKVKVYGNLLAGEERIFDGYVIRKATGEQLIVSNPSPHLGFVIQSSFKQ